MFTYIFKYIFTAYNAYTCMNATNIIVRYYDVALATSTNS